MYTQNQIMDQHNFEIYQSQQLVPRPLPTNQHTVLVDLGSTNPHGFLRSDVTFLQSLKDAFRLPNHTYLWVTQKGYNDKPHLKLLEKSKASTSSKQTI